MLVVVHNSALLNVHLNSNVKSPTEKETKMNLIYQQYTREI